MIPISLAVLRPAGARNLVYWPGLLGPTESPIHRCRETMIHNAASA